MGDQQLAVSPSSPSPSIAALDAIRSGVRDAVRDGIADSNRGGGGGGGGNQRPTRNPGDQFTKCEYCSQTVHYALNPKICARPYRPCNNDCPAKKPKAIHIRCAQELVRKCRINALSRTDADDDEEEGPIGFECDVCKGNFEVNVTQSTANMFVNLCCNVISFVVFALIAVFFVTGYVWQYTQFRAIVDGRIPTDPINNPALVFLNKTSHMEEVRRPKWSEFGVYNHCVATDAAERIIHQQWLLMSEEDPDGDKRRVGDMGVEERLSAMFALLKENGDPENLSKYYWMCGGNGWWGKFTDYTETCFYATGYFWYGVVIALIAFMFLRGVDYCCGGCIFRTLRKSRAKAVLYIDGKPVRLSGKVSSANQRRKLSMRMVHKD